MAERLDLEARLRALRSPARPYPEHSTTIRLRTPKVTVEGGYAWPEVPTNTSLASPSLPAVTSGSNSSHREAVLASSAAPSTNQPPSITIIQRSSPSGYTRPQPEPGNYKHFPQHQQYEQLQPQYQQPALENYELFPPRQELPTPVIVAPPPPPEQSVAVLLGPDYEAAVRVAQYAIEKERQRMAHTAIDAYIQAGRMLIEIGRQQTDPQLQNIVKKKALALLQRAEGLSDWTERVIAADSSEHALETAFVQAQRTAVQSLTEKEALVNKMKTENQGMAEKLNQLVLLAKMRTRFRRIISDRRARKAEEAAVAAAVVDNDQYVKGDAEDDASPEYFNEKTSSRLSNQEENPPLEIQKQNLINELHSRIGLPEIDHFRTFEPLAADAASDARQQELETELDTAKKEAERLRAAVTEMEGVLRQAALHSKERSIKLEKEREEDLAKVTDELNRVREELELERRLSRTSSGRSSVSSSHADESDAYVESNLIKSLRNSLFGSRKTPRSGDRNQNPGAHPVQRASHVHNSPRHSAGRYNHVDTDEEEDEVEEEDDGGVWL